MLNFLKKIILMKKAEGSFVNHSNIYKKFEEFLGKLDNKEHLRKCLYIIAYSKYKEGKYKDASENLVKILKNLQEEEDKLLKINDSLEQKFLSDLNNK